ncbi:MAG: signal peptidase II [Chloroflexota bacterium]
MSRPTLLFLLLALGVVLADQLTKAWVVASFAPADALAAAGSPGAPTEVLGTLVRIARTANAGGIFGLFGDAALPLALAGSLVCVAIVVVQLRAGRSDPLLAAALGLLLGGALGNLVDRVRLGYVVDFVDAGIGDLRWYTFNVADAAISIAIVLLLVHAAVGGRSRPAGPAGGAA